VFVGESETEDVSLSNARAPEPAIPRSKPITTRGLSPAKAFDRPDPRMTTAFMAHLRR